MKLSIIDKIRLASKINSTVNAVEEGISMKNVTKVVLAIVSLLTMALGLAPVQAAVTGFLASHPVLACVIAGITTVLAVVHNPNAATVKDPNPPAANVNILTGLLILALFLVAPAGIRAQTAPAAPTLPSNVYAFGASYNNAAKPTMAGTLTYAHLLASGTTGCANILQLCYGYTVMDILPLSFNPAVVGTNFGVGIAQKVLSIGDVGLYMPVAAGPTITGNQIGWNWSGGGLADIPFKKAGVATAWGFQPNVRFVNATVNGQSGYQLIFGANIRFAQ